MKLIISEYTLKRDCYSAEDMANKTVQDGPQRVTGYKEEEIKNMGKDKNFEKGFGK